MCKTGPAQPQRLNRILSLAGLTSRRHADEWIRSGRVAVNDQVVTEPGTKAVWGVDLITVDAREIPKPSQRLYLMLNKPFGYICSMSDPEGRPMVRDLLKDISERVYPVGRLDFDTLGLLLLTNDGEWAHRLTHPKYRVPRTYKATVKGEINDRAIRLLNSGVETESGGPSLRGKATVITRNERQSVLRLTITQGKSRQVRRMLDAVGYRVIHLIRTAFGTLSLQDLKVGQYRHLQTEEVEDT
ncbi:MAG: rRNA pseudouridine synthase, partial [Desulfobacteraceae bacterium]|nr:rRNA pseudouridine synthase [Desulfobacteraceae bacterium]